MADKPKLEYLDQLPLSREGHARLDEQVALTFQSPHGQKVLEYLQRLTVNRVLDHSASDAQIRMQEGQRQLYAFIKQRMMAHERRKRGELTDG